MTTATSEAPLAPPSATAESVPGIPAHRDVQGAIPDTPREEIEAALATLSSKKDDWTKASLADRRAILGELIRDYSQVAARWAEAVREAEGIPKGTPTAGEEWLAGPYMVVRNLRLLAVALEEMEIGGKPRIPGRVRTRPDGQVTAQVFPQGLYDRLFYTGVTAEVWMEPEVRVEALQATQAVAYGSETKGEVSLVLGAGNVSSIGPMDLLYKLFVENKVVILKMHPLNAYLGPLVSEGFQALLDWGVLRVVYGGVEVGEFLCQHPEVDEIHITGSDKTVEAIVFGPGEEGRKRKAEKKPRNERPISSELGNVSPVIVVPGPWSAGDLDYHGENLVSMLTNNAGFNCNAARVILQHQGWPKRQGLLAAVRKHLGNITPRKAYYPGASDRHSAFLTAHPQAELFGTPGDGELPWTLVPDVDAEAEREICFDTEAFCGVFSETALEAESVADYLDRAVEFCNDRLWGTLNATLLVHPASLKDPEVAAAFDRALANLRYGTVAINSWAAVCYGLVITPWGAFPGHDIYDIQSGTGVVHNTLMFEKVQKTIVRTPFRMMPKPVWFQSHRTVHRLAEKLTTFEASPSPMKLPGIFWEALRG